MLSKDHFSLDAVEGNREYVGQSSDFRLCKTDCLKRAHLRRPVNCRTASTSFSNAKKVGVYACSTIAYTNTIEGTAEKQSLITIYRLLTVKNKLPFSISVRNKKRKFAISVFCLQQRTEVVVFRLFRVYIHIRKTELYVHMYMFAAVSNRKQKPRRFSFTPLQFAHHENRS